MCVLFKFAIFGFVDMQCDEGWKGASGDFGNFCYQVMYKRLSWKNARESCTNFGGDLFSVRNAYEQRYVKQMGRLET